jgi:hypothetical protein
VLNLQQRLLFADSGLLGLLHGLDPTLLSSSSLRLQIQSSARALLQSGCRSIAEAAPLQQLAWVLEVLPVPLDGGKNKVRYLRSAGWV